MGYKRHSPACDRCAEPMKDHALKMDERGRPGWQCPSSPLCVCGKPNMPGRHGAEFCSRA